MPDTPASEDRATPESTVLASGELARIDAFRRGDLSALRSVLNAYSPFVHTAATRMIGEAEAAVVTNDAMFNAFRWRHLLRDTVPLRQQLLAFLRQRLLIGTERQVRRLLNPEQAIQEVLSKSEGERLARSITPDVVAAIDQLPIPTQLILALVRLDGLSIDETATLLGLSPQTIRAHLEQAPSRLHDLLADENREHEDPDGAGAP